MSLIQDSLGTLPIVGKLIDPNRAERLLTKWTGNKPLTPDEARKALGNFHGDDIPSATISNKYLTIGESFATEIKLPAGV